MIRVFLADDHDIVREGLRRVLEAAPDIQVAGEALDGSSALAEIERLKELDVVVLDLSLPRMSGIEVLRRLREQAPFVRVLILSMFPERQYARRMEALGAAGYIGKTRAANEVLRAIRAIAKGETYFPQMVSLPSTGGAPHETLTPREYQVFMLLLQGHSTSDIATELGVSASTASNHITATRTKLACHTVADVIRYAAREGLIEAPPNPDRSNE